VRREIDTTRKTPTVSPAVDAPAATETPAAPATEAPAEGGEVVTLTPGVE
jgi:hypothetical protein